MFLKDHWRAVAVSLALLGAFATGRFATPTKTVTQTVERVVTKTVTVKAKARVVYRDRTVIQKPDGTVERRDVERTEQTTVAATEHEAEHAATVTVTASPPQWRASLLAGVDFPHLDRPALLGPIQLGAMVERRIAGPLWIGAWGMSSGVGGLALSLEF